MLSRSIFLICLCLAIITKASSCQTNEVLVYVERHYGSVIGEESFFIYDYITNEVIYSQMGTSEASGKTYTKELCLIRDKFYGIRYQSTSYGWASSSYLYIKTDSIVLVDHVQLQYGNSADGSFTTPTEAEENFASIVIWIVIGVIVGIIVIVILLVVCCICCASKKRKLNVKNYPTSSVTPATYPVNSVVANPTTYPVAAPSNPGAYPVATPSNPGAYPVAAPSNPGAYPVAAPNPSAYPVAAPSNPAAYPVAAPNPATYPVASPNPATYPVATAAYPVATVSNPVI